MAKKTTVVKRATRKALPFTPEIRARWRKVRAAILAEPKKYDQGEWGHGARPTCSAPACLSGWFHHFTPKQRKRDQFGSTIASDMPGFDTSTLTDGAAIGWPEPFYTQWHNERYGIGCKRRPAVLAKIAAARITHLLRTGE